MKTKILILILTISNIVGVVSQESTLELTFTAKYSGLYVSLDSILIENLTQGGDTTLFSPDTILVLEYITSIGDSKANESNSISVSQNHPNPFSGQTTINIGVTKKETIDISIHDLLGRELLHYSNSLN